MLLTETSFRIQSMHIQNMFILKLKLKLLFNFNPYDMKSVKLEFYYYYAILI